VVEISQSKSEQNFLYQWILVCVIGYTIGGIVGVMLGGFSRIFPSMSQSTSDFLANFTMGIVTGGVIGFFQWVVLRNILSNAKWWILAGILGSSIGAIAYSIVFPFTNFSNPDKAQFAAVLLFVFVITITLVGLFKGYLEWLVLRKDFPNSKGWMGIRVLTSIIAIVISLLSISIRRSTDFSILGNSLILLSEGMIQGIIFGVITGRTLNNLIGKKSKMLTTRVQ